MAAEVVMPKLGMAMKEGIVSIWNKKVGDAVKQGEVIANINSEKIEMEVESPQEGILLEIVVPEGQPVPYGTVICYVGGAGEKVNHGTHVQSAFQGREEVAAVAEALPIQTPTLKSSKREIKISPVARKMAETAGIDIELIKGTGPQGRITKEDIEQAIQNPAIPVEEKGTASGNVQTGTQQDVEQLPMVGMRKIIAERMLESLQTSAQLTLNLKADVTDLLLLQKQMVPTLEKREEVKLTMTDFIARAVILSLQQHKLMNSAFIDNQICIYEQIHLGIAVALERGLVVPVVRDAANCSIIELSKNIKSLAKRARENLLDADEMKGSTFTITNLGAYGIEHFTPVLNMPETGILGVGATQDTPVYIGDVIQRRSLLPLSLTFDHRVLDGAPAASFLQTVKRYLEEPVTMLF
jgi:pyruvate dehydrogenase E2 component (dihydrolipoamide acetyltransferase)